METHKIVTEDYDSGKVLKNAGTQDIFWSSKHLSQ